MWSFFVRGSKKKMQIKKLPALDGQQLDWMLRNFAHVPGGFHAADSYAPAERSDGFARLALQNLERQREIGRMRQRNHVQRILRAKKIAESVGTESDAQAQLQILLGGAEVFPADDEPLRQSRDPVERARAIVVNCNGRVQVLRPI